MLCTPHTGTGPGGRHSPPSPPAHPSTSCTGNTSPQGAHRTPIFIHPTLPDVQGQRKDPYESLDCHDGTQRAKVTHLLSLQYDSRLWWVQ